MKPTNGIEHMLENIRYYLHHSYIEKQTIIDNIRSFLSKYQSNFKNRSLLDIGCGSQPYANLFDKYKIHYQGIDFENYTLNKSYGMNKPDFYFPPTYRSDFLLTNISSNCYEIITAFQVLEHHLQPRIFFAEVTRILKDDGYLIITFPFIWQLHEMPYDYFRYTEYAIQSMCQECGLKIIDMKRRGGLFAVISQLSNLWWLDQNNNLLFRKLGYLIVFVPLQYLCLLLDRIFPSNKIFLGYSMVAKKTDSRDHK